MESDMDGTQNDNVSVKTNLVDIDEAMNDYLGTLTSSPQGSARVRVNSLSLDHLQPSFQFPPATPDSSIGEFSLESPIVWRLANAVHMEVQENAKVATFNWNIDRSNSVANSDVVFNQHHHSSQNNSSDHGSSKVEDVRHAPSMEFFFDREKRKGRSSVHDSWLYSTKHDVELSSNNPYSSNIDSNVAKSKPEPKEGTSDSSKGFDEHKLNELTMGINPTPLSEIKRKHSHSPTQTSSLPYLPSITEKLEANKKQSNAGFQFYIPRPSYTATIGSKSTSASSILEESTTVGRNITHKSSQTNPANEKHQHLKNPEFVKLKTATVVDTNASGLSFEQLLRKQRNLPHHQDHLRSMATSQHATTHASITGAMLNASTKKSQYGFGSKHVVPAVPSVDKIDPTRNDASINKTVNEKYLVNNNQITTNFPNVKTSQPHSMDVSSNSQGSPRNARSGEAYERKKARAKNARVMLNDSIDRLGVAMNLAGIQVNRYLFLFLLL
jgi:hypothetical protein